MYARVLQDRGSRAALDPLRRGRPRAAPLHGRSRADRGDREGRAAGGIAARREARAAQPGAARAAPGPRRALHDPPGRHGARPSGAARAARGARARNAGLRGGAAPARLDGAQPARLQPALQRARAARRQPGWRLPRRGARLPPEAAAVGRLRSRARVVRVVWRDSSTSAPSRRAPAGSCAPAARRVRSRSARRVTASSSRRWRGRCRSAPGRPSGRSARPTAPSRRRWSSTRTCGYDGLPEGIRSR